MGLFGAAGAALGGSRNRNSGNGSGISSFANRGGGISGVIGNMLQARMQNPNVQNTTQMTGAQNPGVNSSSIANSGSLLGNIAQQTGIGSNNISAPASNGNGIIGNMAQAYSQNRSNGAGNQTGEAILTGTPASEINAQIPVGQGPIGAVDPAASVDPSQVQSTFSPASQDAAAMMFGTQIDGSFGRQMY